jgi:hypothetical protein
VRVTDAATGRALPGARAFTWVEEGEGRGTLATETTGADGVARIAGLPAGTLVGVFVWKAELGATEARVTGAPPTVADGRVTTVAIAAVRGPSVSGVVRDAEGKPVDGAQVLAWGGSPGMPRTVSGADGRWRLDGLVEGVPARLHVLAPGLAPAGPPPPVPAPSPRGEATVDVVLAAAASVAGRVLDPMGRPAAGLTLGFESEGDEYVLGHPFFTGADGSFLVTGLAARRYTVAGTTFTLAPGEAKTGLEIRLP